MSEIIGVRFKEGGKIYYFRPNDEALEPGCSVIVETVRGTECGEVVIGRRELSEGEFTREIKPIIRRATDKDLAQLRENKAKEARAFDICCQRIKAHGLKMNLLEVEYTFDGSKIIFNFSAEGRVDFRELVKDLAAIFHARIELRQIGVRDEAKMLGGLGICGRPFCCKEYMGDFQSVSIKMAKEQGLSLNPVKISGTCGRLMCCLKHEQEAYEDLMRTIPQPGTPVVTPEGPGVVVERELVAGRVKVKLNGFTEAPAKTFRAADVCRPGEEPKKPAQSEPQTAEAPARERGEHHRRKNEKPDKPRQGKPSKAEAAAPAKGGKPEWPELTERRAPAPSSPSARPAGQGRKIPDKPAIDYRLLDFEENLSGGANRPADTPREEPPAAGRPQPRKINPEDFEEELHPVRRQRPPRRRKTERRNDGDRPDAPKEEKSPADNPPAEASPKTPHRRRSRPRRENYPQPESKPSGEES